MFDLKNTRMWSHDTNHWAGYKNESEWLTIRVFLTPELLLSHMIMSENTGGVGLTDKQVPVEAPPPSYPIPQTAPAPANPANALAAIGQQYRDQCESHTSLAFATALS